jgi:hypothetical protein
MGMSCRRGGKGKMAETNKQSALLPLRRSLLDAGIHAVFSNGCLYVDGGHVESMGSDEEPYFKVFWDGNTSDYEYAVTVNGAFQIIQRKHAFANWSEEEIGEKTDPEHYRRFDAMECWDEMETVFGIKKTMTFCLLNVWKYRYRAADKGGYLDLSKSDVYMKKYSELQERLQKKANRYE